MAATRRPHQGEADPARPSDLEISFDGGPFSLHRSSGVLLATQLGSGAWMRSSWSVHQQQVRAVLEAFATQDSLGDSLANVDIAAITARANCSLLQHDDPMLLQYLVRDVAPRLMGQGVPSFTLTPHGLANTVRVRPLGWDMVLSIDGLPPLRLPSHCMVTLEIEPDKSLWIHTAKFSPPLPGISSKHER